jgi:hypothetical protein
VISATGTATECQADSAAPRVPGRAELTMTCDEPSTGSSVRSVMAFLRAPTLPVVTLSVLTIWSTMTVPCWPASAPSSVALGEKKASWTFWRLPAGK